MNEQLEKTLNRNTKITLGIATSVLVAVLTLAWKAAVWTTSMEAKLEAQSKLIENMALAAKELSLDVKSITGELSAMRISILSTQQKMGLLEASFGTLSDQYRQLERKQDKIENTNETKDR